MGVSVRAHWLAAAIAASALTAIPVLAADDEDGVVPAGEAATEDDVIVDAPPSDPPVRQARLDEIVVSAQRREESLQDVPVSVNAFSGDDLKNANISESHGLQLKTPGMVYNSQGGYAHIYIRGIGSDGTLPSSEGSIGTFLDGVYNPNANSSIQHFADVERVEVLKGPQGTLFGRNTTGGAINITTRKPADEWSSTLSVYGGSYKRIGADAFVTGPITDWFKFSVAGYYDRSDHYYENINPNGVPIEDVKDWGIRAKLLFQPFDDFEVLINGYITDHYGPDTTVANNLRTSLLTELAGGRTETSNTPYKSNADRGPYYNEYRNTALDIHLTYANDWFEIKSISAYLDTDNSGFIELDYTEADLEEVPVPRGFSETYSQEIQIASTWDEPFQYLLGAFYLESKGGFDPLEVSIGPTSNIDTVLGALQDLVSPLGLGQLIGGLFPGGFPDAIILRTTGIIETKAWAGFGNASVELWEQLTFRAGIRYSTETRFLTKSETKVELLGLPFTPTILSSPPDERTWSAWTPMASIEWRPDNVMYYLKVAEGFKSGNWNPVLLLEPLIPVEPEKIKSVEVGFKGDFFDQRVRFNMAGYWYDYQDLQVQVVSIVSSGTARIENAGNARVYGAEAQLAIAPTPDLLINAGAAWIHSEYLEYIGTGYDEMTGLAFEGDFSGNELNRAPRWTANADATYTFNVWGGPLDVSANIYYASGWYFDAQNTVEQEAYIILGARVSYLHEESGVRLSVIGTNLTDKAYLMNALLHDFGVHGTYAPPRKILARLDWTF